MVRYADDAVIICSENLEGVQAITSTALQDTLLQLDFIFKQQGFNLFLNLTHCL